MAAIKIEKADRPLGTIAIVGRPNVGKSSLFNAAAGRRLSIVHEMPGVTRDRVAASLIRNGRRFELIDTGGLGLFGASKADMWDERIASQVEIAVADADVLIMVTDVQSGLTPLDEEVASRLRVSGKPVLLAVNKCDNPELAAAAPLEFSKLGFKNIFSVTCQHRGGVGRVIDAALQRLPGGAEALKADGEEETVLESPISIAVVGRPNVGKSSLVNALLGEDRVMVSPVAGTTRDAIDIDFTLTCNGESRPAVLVDTAGLRKRAKVDTVVELFSAMRAGNAISRASLVLLVVEASVDGMTAQDRRIASMIEQAGRACVIVANKMDLCMDTAKTKELERVIRHSLPGMNYAPVVFVSAKEHRNLDLLLDRMAMVMDQLKMEVTTGVLNRVIADAFVSHTPPVVGAAPLKLFYATAAGRDPLRIVLFVNNPKYCPDNYLSFIKNTVRDAFDLVGMPIEIKLKARPKKIQSIRHDTGAPGGAPTAKKRSTGKYGKRK